MLRIAMHAVVFAAVYAAARRLGATGELPYVAGAVATGIAWRLLRPRRRW